MVFSKETIEVLNQALTVHQRQAGGGKSYPYVKGEDVINQLNKAFGHAWSSKVLSTTEAHDQVLMSVELTAHIINNGNVVYVSHHGYGSSPIARKRDDNKVIDIGNCYKSAFTIALKKAAEQFGIGLGGEEEAPKPAPFVKREAYVPQAAKPAPTPVAPVAQKPAVAAPAAPQSKSSAVSAMASSTKKISDVQKTALDRISAMKGFSEGDLVSKALEGSGKTSFEELTEGEAIQVIRFANTSSGK